MANYKQNKATVIENSKYFKALSEHPNAALIYVTIECLSTQFVNDKHFSDRELFTRCFFKLRNSISINQFWDGIKWLMDNEFYGYTDCVSIDTELFLMLKEQNNEGK